MLKGHQSWAIFQYPISHNGQISYGIAADRGRGEGSSSETGSDQGQPQSKPESFWWKKRWLVPPSDKLEIAECFYSEAPLQDEEVDLF